MATLTVSLGLKTALVLVTSSCLHAVVTPPHSVDESKAEKYADGDQGEKAFLATAPTGKLVAWSAAAVEIYLMWTTPMGARITSWTILGVAVTLCGTWIRLWCYKLLGHRFTFELATHLLVKDSERPYTNGSPSSSATDSPLITTGPYAIMRHPSYFGACTAFYGACILFLAPGSALSSSHCHSLLISLVRGAMILLGLSLIPLMPTRIHKEEAMLHDEFGEVWDRYVRDVRWAVLPGIY
ncbi:hypothetical protein EXIGLDRAFT_653853 [Exidia glandulosa HHB12029]|uniref:Protein-S-isoprenylcysteine O-methyltransferase n=1 Tax=Exidia glandulosa HHB12029 TaxID=1314781 RepID=A0A165DZ39_EXIGL|nr:hypothetical protein EXIGLDRAFT_653853 [Exidia glandulosa HHB12029]